MWIINKQTFTLVKIWNVIGLSQLWVFNQTYEILGASFDTFFKNQGGFDILVGLHVLVKNI